MTTEFKGIKITVSFFFALTVAILGMFDKSGKILLCLLFAALHECGHLLVILISKEKPKEIAVTPFGIRIERKAGTTVSFKNEALCAFAGPLVNLIFSLIFYIADKKIFENLIFVNLTLALINLLPCEPLDGGKIVENLLKAKFPEETSEKFLTVISCVTIFPVAVLGFIMLFQSQHNFSLLLLCFYIIFYIAMKKKGKTN